MEAYKRLEREFATWMGLNVNNMVACSSGTAALHLAIEALELPKGSYILVPNYTMIACARAVTLAGHVPIFVDCNSDLLMDICQIGYICREVTHRSVTAVIPVHIYGRACNMRGLNNIAARYGLRIIEDLAECHQLSVYNKSAAAAWSFYKNKLIAGEEGGAVYYRDSYRAEKARSLRSLGSNQDNDYWHSPGGHNYRMSNVHAELILDSLKEVEQNIVNRANVVEIYDSVCPAEWKQPPRDTNWFYDIRIPNINYSTASRIVKTLQEHGVEARESFKPMSMQLEYLDSKILPLELRSKKDSLSPLNIIQEWRQVTEKASREVILLPVKFNFEFTKTMALKIFDTVESCLKNPQIFT